MGGAFRFPRAAGRRLRHVEHAGQIYGDYAVPLFRSDVEKIVSNADTGIVDKNVHAAHEFNGFYKCGAHLLQIGDISFENLDQARQFARDFFSSGVVAIEYANDRALLEKSRRSGSSDTASATSD